MASQTYTVNFLLKLMTKDLLYAQNEAAQCKVDLKTAEVVRSLFETAIEQGLGDKDMASVIEPLRKTLHGVWSKQPTTPLPGGDCDGRDVGSGVGPHHHGCNVR